MARRKAEAEPEAQAPTELERRNSEIVAARFRGLSWGQLARTYGITERRCQQIVAEWREQNPGLRVLGAADPLAVVDDLLEQYQGAAEELALVAATTKNDNVRVGAIRSRMDALRSITELLQATGILPRDLGQLHVEIDSRHVAMTLFRVLDEHGVAPDVQDAIVEALQGGELEPAGGG